MENGKYQFVVDYIKEGKESRASLRSLIFRTLNAYAGHPMHNAYADRFFGNSQNTAFTANKRQQIQARCKEVPEGYDDTIYNVVETIVSMAMGTPEQYKFDLYDKYQQIDDDFIDRMAAFADYVYRYNKLDSLMPQIVRDVVRKGASYLYLSWDNDKKAMDVTLLDPAKVFDDPFALRTNHRRYRGFGNWENWNQLKSKITNVRGEYKLNTIGDVDAYLSSLQNAWTGLEYNTDLNDVIRKDLGAIYGIVWEPINRQSGSSLGDQDKSPLEPNQYLSAGDVWVDYIWDYTTHTRYTVVNERFVIDKEEHPLRTSVDVVTYETKYDPDKKDFTQNKHTNSRSYELDDPIVEFAWIKDDNTKYPTTPLWLQLKPFDDLCAAKSLFVHNVSIAGPINFVGSSYDAELSSLLTGMAGEFIEGMVGQVSVLNKQFDSSMLTTYIQNLKDSIKQSMGAVDQYQLQSMIGNRATAEEVGTVSGVASQRMNALIANLETSMAEFTYKAFMIYLKFGFADDKVTISFPFKGAYGEITRQQLATQFNLSVRLSSSIKTEQISMAKNAIQVLGYGMNNEYVDQGQLFALLIPMILRGQVSATQARSLIKKDYINDLNVVSLLAEARSRENARAAIVGPVKMSDLQGLSSQDLDTIMNYAQGAPADSSAISPEQSSGRSSESNDTIPPAGNNPYNQMAKSLADSGAGVSPQQLAQMMGTDEDSQSSSQQYNQQEDALAQLGSGTPAMAPGTTPDQAGQIANQ